MRISFTTEPRSHGEDENEPDADYADGTRISRRELNLATIGNTESESTSAQPTLCFVFLRALRVSVVKGLFAMNLLLLGRGKTGALVEEVARERGHTVEVLTSSQNRNASALTPERLRNIDVVIDFSNPEAVLENMRACIRNGARMVVGTTGWYEHLDEIRKNVESSKSGLLYGSNFSIGVNLFFQIAETAAHAVGQGYVPRIVERHHAQKKDSPSGTAVSIQRIVAEVSTISPEITSVREGDTVGTHVLLFDSSADTMMLVHDAKSRRGFAEGAVRAAEWLKGKSGFYEFRKIFRELATGC